MESVARSPLQGVKNIIRFNWHFYAITFVWVALLTVASFLFNTFQTPIFFLLIFTMAGVLISLLVSFYIYDVSEFYSFKWLRGISISNGDQIVNIHAGFDETSSILTNQFPNSNLKVFDFYDPKKHTEISIERARMAYPPFPGTQKIDTNQIPLQMNSVDFIFLIFSAHEIRNDHERIDFFKELTHALKPNGKIVLVEHLRDAPNFIAYNIGYFHFLARKTWLQNFSKSSLRICSEYRHTLFVTIFILQKNGTAS